MLSENLKSLRKARGLSQEELARKLNVVRQTISKWEKGLSVPDSEMLIRIAEELDTAVTVLLGESVEQDEPEDIRILSEKLELLNEQFAKQKENRRRIWRAIFIAVGVIAGVVLLGGLAELLHTQAVVHSMEENSAIIGGAAGPTAIVVAAANNPARLWILAGTAAVISVIGICKTRRR